MRRASAHPFALERYVFVAHHTPCGALGLPPATVAAGAQDYCKPGTDTSDCEHGDDEFHEGECPYENDGEVSAARDHS